MKPTQYNSDHNQRPRTDFHYQSKLEESAASATATAPATDARERSAFWKLGTAANAGSLRDYAFELAISGIIGVAAAWPILFMVVSITRLVRNY